ncbi:MAG: hypothetical protein ACOCXA_07195, partial [Planctomycetota bacterium]
MRLSLISCLPAVLALSGSLSAADATPPLPDPGEGWVMINEGNSLMGQLHVKTTIGDQKKVELLPGLAHVFGFPAHDAEGVGAAGIPIDWAWENPGKRQEFFDDLASRDDWSALTVMPFGYN